MTYIVTWEDHYEPGEEEFEVDDAGLEDAKTFCLRVMDDGGIAFISDEDGNEIDPNE